MFGSITDGLKGVQQSLKDAGFGGDDEDEGEEAESSGAAAGQSAADREVADIDARAQTGELSFRDFLTMSEAFAGLGVRDATVQPRRPTPPRRVHATRCSRGAKMYVCARGGGACEQEGKQLPGMPTLTPAQLAETRQKFETHSKIVEVMLDDEMDAPELLIDDLKAGGSTPGPRIQRLAIASNLPETEVGLFLMQFEAMRESTRRIAAGEDPDEVNTSMAAPPGSNRAARRKAKAKKKKAKK